MQIFDLKDAVIVGNQPVPMAGRVWGRTFEEMPKYNVLTDSGEILKDVPVTQLRLIKEENQ